VLFLGVGEESGKHGHPAPAGKPPLPRTYTLTHSDVTASLTLAVSYTINRAQLQGWYNRLQRDEVVAEWKKVRGRMSLHVHCHISGGHFLLDLIAGLRYYIFRKELPVVRTTCLPAAHTRGNTCNLYVHGAANCNWFLRLRSVHFTRLVPERDPNPTLTADLCVICNSASCHYPRLLMLHTPLNTHNY
jgi:hypothetical protein